VKDAKIVFGLKFSDFKKTPDLNLGDSKLDRLSQASQAFLVKGLQKFTETFPEDQSIKTTFDGFKGNDFNMNSHIEYFFRSVVMVGFENGVFVSGEETAFDCLGEFKGCHDLVVYRDERPVIICSFARTGEKSKGLGMEKAFCSNLFELYSQYWKAPGNDVFGCISDLNNWIFLKYDGKKFYRTHRIYKLALHNTAVVSLAIKILNILESRINLIN
jgi:hypothetical protein